MGTQVAAGDLVVADDDGVVVIPAAQVEKTSADGKARADKEEAIHEQLRQGDKYHPGPAGLSQRGPVHDHDDANRVQPVQESVKKNIVGIGRRAYDGGVMRLSRWIVTKAWSIRAPTMRFIHGVEAVE